MSKTDFNALEGVSVKTDPLYRQLYATDASVYKIYPEGVCFPANREDIVVLVHFAREKGIPIIPRAGGTSLAGQVVGKGLIVDVSKHFNQIIHFDAEAKSVTVAPGIVRDELNDFLAPHGLFFGPNTSTSNRCTIGGMTGNNSSGTTSIQYGVTRDKVLSLECVLSDGSIVTFEKLNDRQCREKEKQEDLEGELYRFFREKLNDPDLQKSILSEYPQASVHRRNTGYALDVLLEGFVDSENTGFNFSKLLTGSEGTLAFVTSITLALDDLPPKKGIMVAAHFDTISKCLNAVAPLMQHPLHTCEMMDKTILDCTKNNRAQAKNRFFIKGDPQGILMLELRADDPDLLDQQLAELIKTLEESGLAYDYAILRGAEIKQALTLRSAGLGLLGNIIGDEKAVACIEDTAVPVDQLADYIAEFTTLMEQFDQQPVYYAHAGAGELHLRPILNLKKKKGVKDFKAITTAVAHLVKKYRGSMSGEHGDGIVRSEYISMVLGEKNYQLIESIKQLFDPYGIFNPGKIVAALPMDQNLRYVPDRKEPKVETFMDFSSDEGLLRATEKCNGSGDCRKTTSDATLCPSYRATKDEKDSTRGRANVLREVLTTSDSQNPFDNPQIKEVMQLCISCKACTSECPSSVDMATYKAEFLFQYQKAHPASLRDRLFAYNGLLSKRLQPIRLFQNTVFKTPFLGNLIKITLGIAKQRTLPQLHAALDKRLMKKKKTQSEREVYLYLDEFTNYLDVKLGEEAFELLSRLGYRVLILPSTESGRAYVSKGFLKQAKACANRNVALYKDLISSEVPLLGVEPSALYTFKDEYLKLADDKTNAQELAKNCFLIEEFIAREIDHGYITSKDFTEDPKTIKIHAHCYQKSLGNPADTFKMLNLPKNYKVTLLATGCCGMAGSFGYEAEHYQISQKIGEERLFPAIRKMEAEAGIAANGTSCRHQILDGANREGKHPVSLLYQALN